VTQPIDRFTLYPLQAQAVAFIEECDGCALLACDLGTGKTRMSLKYAHDHGTRVLIVAPMVVVRVWEQEIRKVWPEAKVAVLTGGGSVAKQAETLRREADAGLQIAIVHYDAYWRGDLRKAILKWKPDTIIADECQSLKNRTSRRAKFAHELTAQPWCQHRLGLSGTPTDAKLRRMFDRKSKLHNLFSIMWFVDPTLFGKRWADFEGDYCVLSRGTPVPLIIGYRRIPTIERKTRERAFLIPKEEMLDLPPCVDVRVEFDLDPKTRATYDEFKKYSIAELDGLSEDGQTVNGTVISRLAILSALKLQQICCGSVILDDSTVIDIGDEKLRVCCDLIESAIAGTNIVVGCRFRRNVRRVEETCAQMGFTVRTLIGGMSKQERDEALDTFDAQDRVVLVSQIQAGSLGISLVKANVCIMYSSGTELDRFIQFHGRLDRPGQKRSSTFLHLIARKTVEERLYSDLLNGIDVSLKARSLSEAKKLLA
jgi:SNF2 family DNA or RNA helicase